MKVSTEIDNNFGYEKITQLVDNIPLIDNYVLIYHVRYDIWSRLPVPSDFYRRNKEAYQLGNVFRTV